jgi:hypothetical protein
MDDLLKERLGISATTIKDGAEIVGKFALATVAVAYVAGLIVTNLHLRSYGLAGVSLVRAEYVLTGSLWLTLVGIGYVSARILLAGFRRAMMAWKTRARISSIAYVIASLGTAFGLINVSLSILAQSWPGEPEWHFRVAILVVLLFPAALWPTAVWLRTFLVARATDKDDTTTGQHGVIAIIALLLALFLHAEIVHPLILPAYGVGRLIRARVVLMNEARSTKMMDRLDLDGRDDWRVVADTDHWVVLTTAPAVKRPFSKSRSVRLRHELVAAVVSWEE